MSLRGLTYPGLFWVALVLSALAASPWPAWAENAVTEPVAEAVYQGGLSHGWTDWGWSPRKTVPPGGPAVMSLAEHGGWILSKRGLSGPYGALTFRMRAPPSFRDFLEVRLDADRPGGFPRVAVRAAHRSESPDGWVTVRIPWDELNPQQLVFDRLVLSARESVSNDWVSFDTVFFTQPRAATKIPLPARAVRMSVDCGWPAQKLNPGIWGINHPVGTAPPEWWWELRPSGRSFGGPLSSRYNPMKDVTNTGASGNFRNFSVGSPGMPSWQAFLAANAAKGIESTLTLPLLGFVAKDGSSSAGDGLLPPAERTSVVWSYDDVARWVHQARDVQMKQGRGDAQVRSYALDHTPMRWHQRFPDLHPEPVGYEELVDRTLQYARVVRGADPQSVVVSPAFLGFWDLQFSGRDLEAGASAHPDRKAHGNVPLLPFFLKRLKEAQDKQGQRAVDVVAVQWFPQGPGLNVGASGKTDAATAALRIRSTRSLWDPSYKDESWMGEPVRLFPRLEEMIAAHAPGLTVSLSEYGFGAETHMSGGLALAEALGRIAQANPVSAFHWKYPERYSPAYWAFRAFRNYDGQGSSFGDELLSTSAGEGTSVFAGRDSQQKRIVLVMLNLDPDRPAQASLQLMGCGKVQTRKSFTYTEGSNGLVAERPTSGVAALEPLLPPYSIQVAVLNLE